MIIRGLAWNMTSIIRMIRMIRLLKGQGKEKYFDRLKVLLLLFNSSMHLVDRLSFAHYREWKKLKWITTQLIACVIVAAVIRVGVRVQPRSLRVISVSSMRTVCSYPLNPQEN